MYHQYFGLEEAPFSIAVNPRYLFMSPRHRDALAHLLYGVGAGGGFILLTGEVGTGKTTINRCLLEQLPHDTDIAIILNPALNAMELLATVCDELGIGYDPDKHTLKSLTDSLHRFLLENYDRGRKTVLMIDEAQHLDFDVLEQIRLLTNLETNSEKLLQIILIGQPELAEMLNRPELRQLNQRITARYDLGPLTREETAAYIRHRLQVAGMPPGRDLFPTRVVTGIHRRTRGIPRLINVLCDRMLLGAYGRNKSRVDTAMLRQASQEVLGQSRPAGAAASRSLAGWVLAPLMIVLLGITGWWLWQYFSAGTASGPTPVAVAPPPVEQRAAPLPATPLPAATQAPQPATPQPAAMPYSLDGRSRAPLEGESPAAIPAEVEVGPLSGQAAGSMSLSPAAAADWLQPRQQAESRLWSLLSLEPQPPQLCPAQVQAGLACVQGQAKTWDELGRFDRPMLLELVTVDRFAAAALLLGMEGRSAWLATEAGAVRVDLSLLGPLWSGAYRFLWRPPLNFNKPLKIGDESPAVSEVALMFAKLDGQQLTLADRQFSTALQQRVRLFQRQRGLLDDGVVGMQTLLKLNEALGIGETAAQLRDRMGYAEVPAK